MACAQALMAKSSLDLPSATRVAIQRGIKVGQESDAIFLKKIETAFHLPLEEARAALGVRGAVDVDTHREGAFWAGRAELEPA